jgi:hypothetical protein
MGLSLSRVDFLEWVESVIRRKERPQFFSALSAILRGEHDWESWDFDDGSYQRIGSYTRYGIFVLCLVFLTSGYFESELEEDENIEREALKVFRQRLRPGQTKIDYVSHFTETGDTDTIFIPVLFPRPLEYKEIWVASALGAVSALEEFAKELGFSLVDEPESEEISGEWDAIATVKNVARDLYVFFREKPGACIAYV